jgi:hypothetical protein
MMQRERDFAAGLNTAGLISGYRGSPLGGLDQTLWKARQHLEAHHIRFQPGVNEDLAATALWGAQQVNLFPGAKYDGVFGMWYGKGPGVDRCGDVFRHANAAGTSKFGGVLAVAGDDHAARSSTVAHQTEHLFKAVMMPVLNPSGVQDYLDLGLHGWAMSRYSGCWVAFKAVADTIESSASVYIDPQRVDIALPETLLPPGGLNIRWPDDRLVQEERLLHHKLYAALAYARVNRSTGLSSTARIRGWASSPAASPTSTCARPSTTSASTTGSPPRSASALQGRHGVAAGIRGRAAFRRGAGGNPGRRGEAPARRISAEGGTLQLARGRAPARHRQVRREGRMGAAARRVAAAGLRRADAGHDRPRHRRAHRPLCHLRPHPGAPGLPRSQRAGAGEISDPDRSASRISAPAARTTPRPACRRAAARWPASAAISWRPG